MDVKHFQHANKPTLWIWAATPNRNLKPQLHILGGGSCFNSMSHLIPNHNQTRWKQNYWLRDLIKYISRLLRNQIRCCLGFCNRFICLFDLVNFVNLLFELYWHLGSISWNWEPTWTSSTATTNTSTETRLKSGFQIHTKTPEKRMLLYSAQNCLVTCILITENYSACTSEDTYWWWGQSF